MRAAARNPWTPGDHHVGVCSREPACSAANRVRCGGRLLEVRGRRWRALLRRLPGAGLTQNRWTLAWNSGQAHRHRGAALPRARRADRAAGGRAYSRSRSTRRWRRSTTPRTSAPGPPRSPAPSRSGASPSSSSETSRIRVSSGCRRRTRRERCRRAGLRSAARPLLRHDQGGEPAAPVSAWASRRAHRRRVDRAAHLPARRGQVVPRERRKRPLMDQLAIHPYPNPSSPTDAPNIGYPSRRATASRTSHA